MAILDRIKFDGLASRDWLVFRYYSDNIVFGSQLIVGEGQVVIFVKGGSVCDVFYPGTYTMDTQNLPILSSIINMPFGGKTPFTAEIYFINTITKLDIDWGTPDPIQLVDPKYQIRINVRAFGQIGLKISDTVSFFKNLIGSMSGSNLVKYDETLSFFKGILITKLKSIIAQTIIEDKISALEITAQLSSISDKVLEEISKDFSKFGFNVVNFYIKSINFPQEDFDRINKILEDKAAFEIMGDSRYATKRSLDVYETVAGNENGAAGAFATGGIGLGFGINMANNISGNMNSSLNVPANDDIYCPSCNAPNGMSAKFCNKCGSSLVQKLDVVKCPGCNNDVPANSRFCPSCGISLMPKTCSCGAEVAVGAKFCSNCGKKIEE